MFSKDSYAGFESEIRGKAAAVKNSIEVRVGNLKAKIDQLKVELLKKVDDKTESMLK
jgi:uncharacterized small protein (DUF1192 family)